MYRTCQNLIRLQSSYRFWAVFLIIIGWVLSLHADTTWVAGNVSGVWGRRGNPYLVTDTLTIPHDSTLQIMPGVQIYFQNQQIRRTPINVLGRLRAIGEEGDSIYFYSPIAGFGEIHNRFTPGTEIRLEYCVLDSFAANNYVCIFSQQGASILKHCRILRLGGDPLPSIVTWHDDVDTVLHCNLLDHTVCFESGGFGVFQYNRSEGFGSGLLVGAQLMAPLVGNQVYVLHIAESGFVDIYDNEADVVLIDVTGSNCHDNYIGSLSIFQSNFTVERNTIGSTSIDESAGIIQWNELGNTRIDASSNITFQNNLVISGNSGMTIEGTCNVVIQQNTFVFDDKGIESNYGLGTNQVVNNIFVGDGVNSIGVFRGLNGNSFLIRYNDFYNVTATTSGCQLGPGNIMLDPCFRAGNPYDYQLQANSPCINTGDPTSPRDPDSTRADMGCYFFDHRIDNPPAIISPVVVNIQRGTTLRYIAQATDDYGPLSFDFWNLPAWLYRVPELMDFEQKTAVVSGRVPQGQGNFTFGVWVEDGAAQRDSQVVSVLVSPYTILAGEVTGILTQEQSPYMVVEDVIVPAGDSLIIEPGVEIRFQWEPVVDLRHRIVVRGKLHAVGTSEDTIYFLPEYGDSLARAWRGIQCIATSLDTSRISYSYFSHGYYGMVVDSQASLMVQHAKIIDTRYGFYVANEASAEVDSCQFYVEHPYSNYFVYSDSASVIVSNCHSEFLVPYQHGMHFDCRYTQGLVSNCTLIISGWGTRSDYWSIVDFIGNRIINSELSIMNGSSGYVCNNLLSGSERLGLFGADSLLVSNNLLYHTEGGIAWSDPIYEVYIANNIFLLNGYGLNQWSSSQPFTNISYNDFYGNDSDFVNCIPDSTNLFLDAMIQDTINFRLSLGSPCIDAGDPNPFFNDVDSTRNDIGCWGGPWGESYIYPQILTVQTPKPIPLEFALLPPYPNPFNSVLIIPFTLPVVAEVTITIYNILGQKVHQYTSPPLPPGVHRVVWNSGSCASGLYIIQLKTGDKQFKKKALLIK